MRWLDPPIHARGALAVVASITALFAGACGSPSAVTDAAGAFDGGDAASSDGGGPGNDAASSDGGAPVEGPTCTPCAGSCVPEVVRADYQPFIVAGGLLYRQTAKPFAYAVHDTSYLVGAPTPGAVETPFTASAPLAQDETVTFFAGTDAYLVLASAGAPKAYVVDRAKGTPVSAIAFPSAGMPWTAVGGGYLYGVQNASPNPYSAARIALAGGASWEQLGDAHGVVKNIAADDSGLYFVTQPSSGALDVRRIDPAGTDTLLHEEPVTGEMMANVVVGRERVYVSFRAEGQQVCDAVIASMGKDGSGYKQLFRGDVDRLVLGDDQSLLVNTCENGSSTYVLFALPSDGSAAPAPLFASSVAGVDFKNTYLHGGYVYFLPVGGAGMSESILRACRLR